tara:strand:+ start:62 stop:355 length:294 start_codon:yes stop_codon:yes gene_type:complete
MKTLVDTLGWVPVLGSVLKTTYIANCAKDVIMKVNVDEKSIKSDNASEYLKDLAEEAYEEFLEPEVNKLDLPNLVTNKAKEKAIDIIVEGLKKKYIK